MPNVWQQNEEVRVLLSSLYFSFRFFVSQIVCLYISLFSFFLVARFISNSETLKNSRSAWFVLFHVIESIPMRNIFPLFQLLRLDVGLCVYVCPGTWIYETQRYSNNKIYTIEYVFLLLLLLSLFDEVVPCLVPSGEITPAYKITVAMQQHTRAKDRREKTLSHFSYFVNLFRIFFSKLEEKLRLNVDMNSIIVG